MLIQKNLCQANIKSGRGFCVLFLRQCPRHSDHAGGIDFYLLQRHCAAVDPLQQVVIITLVAGHWKNAALCQTGKQGRKAPSFVVERPQTT